MQNVKNDIMKKKMFLSGLGGGLDIVNTIPLYYLYKDEYDITFGSIRPATPNDVNPCEIFDNCKQIFKIFSNSIIETDGRYFENKFADLFPNNAVYILSRNLNGRYNDKNLNSEFKKFIAAKGFDEILFIDGGDKNSDGSYGVNVNEDMTYAYIVQANGIHDLKTKIYEN